MQLVAGDGILILNIETVKDNKVVVEAKRSIQPVIEEMIVYSSIFKE